ncbi:hypothetical protein CYMTET_14389 [Cymbomonas tetramitiformis]|uniref:Chromo domain-containing protein n=1 Tax=Cymbomonas tetramitiformis TaxID=36881 RepID=A0AAE0GGP4_9CHLO|nr:hypothetical protein CYMTET_14389 [Cymbomonas tetramitiformis]
MGRRAATKSKKSQPVKTRLPALGKGPIKRTPRHEFDHRDNAENIYDVECIIAERSVKVNGLTVEEWLIRWKGCSDSHDTWEPIENLAGLEDDIAQFRNAKSEQRPLKLGKRRRRTPFDDTTPVAVAATPGESAAAPGYSTGVTATTAEAEDDCVEEDESEHAILRPAMRGRRIAKVWSYFNEIICPTTDKPMGLQCAIAGCAARLACTTNTTNARQHLSHVHKDHLAELEAEEFENAAVAEASATPRVQSVINSGGSSWPPGKRDQLTSKVVNWLCKRARPLSLPERDTELKDVLLFASGGGYTMPSAHNVVRQLCVLSGKALASDRAKIFKLIAAGVSPSTAIDIWSENGIALLGILLYFWSAGANTVEELLVRAVPFGEIAHTGEEIDHATKDALALVGVGKYEFQSAAESPNNSMTVLTDNVRDCLHKAVADGASNVQKGLADFETHPCPVHHVSAMGMVPPQQKALQMFDVESLQLNLSTDEAGSTYRDFQMDLSDWEVVEQSIPVLRPVFHYTRIIQGTKYVTMSLVLPMTAWLIEFELSPTVDITLANNSVLKHKELLHGVQTAREAMHRDFVRRWVYELDESILEDYVVATLLDPRWKNWQFEGCNIFDNGDMTSHRAFGYLRTAWTNFKPSNVEPIAPVSKPVSGNFGESSFMRKKTDPRVTQPERVVRDQLDSYLALPQEPNEDGFDVMLWWNRNAATLPDVYRMARQFLGCPATTAGVERAFSAAGKMHDDLRKNTSEGTLEHMLRVRMSTD